MKIDTREKLETLLVGLLALSLVINILLLGLLGGCGGSPVYRFGLRAIDASHPNSTEWNTINVFDIEIWGSSGYDFILLEAGDNDYYNYYITEDAYRAGDVLFIVGHAVGFYDAEMYLVLPLYPENADGLYFTLHFYNRTEVTS